MSKLISPSEDDKLMLPIISCISCTLLLSISRPFWMNLYSDLNLGAKWSTFLNLVSLVPIGEINNSIMSLSKL